jgi:chromosome segregation ATPase
MTSDQIKDKVFNVCDDLHAKGEKISIRLILSLIDEVASTSTIHKYHALWRDQLEANQDALYEKLGFSSQFTQIFMSEISRFSAEAERRYKESAVTATESRNEAIEALTKVEDKYLKQEALVDSLQQKLDEQIVERGIKHKEHQAEIKGLQSNFETLETEMRNQIKALEAKLIESQASGESLRTELAKAQLKLEQNKILVDEVKLKEEENYQEKENLRKQLSEQNINLATAKSSEAAAVESKRIIDGLYRELKADLAEREAELKDLRAKANELVRVQSERDSGQKMIEQLNSNLKSATTQVSDALEARVDAEAELERQSRDLATVREELKELRVTSDSQQKEIGSLTTLNMQLNKRIESYEHSA